jgi:hypothetical protein
MTLLLLNDNLSVLSANTLELHYYFKNETHTMDAFVQNKCEYDFLGVIKEVASFYKIDVFIETEPLANGGIRRLFTLVSKEESKKSTITIAFVVSLITAVFVTPITSSIDAATKKLIERIFENPELKILEKEKLKLEIENLKLDIKEKNSSLQQNNFIKRKRSNFYESLEKYPKVNQVSFLVRNLYKNEIGLQKDVLRENFKDFVLISDDLEPVRIENAIIEIISPVLKDGTYRWMGIYNGSIIPFNMKSIEFKNLVRTGIVQFKNGTSINCFLEIRRKIDNEGLEKIVGYDVLRVNNYFENDKPIETPEGRHHRQKKEADKRQLGIDFTSSIQD